MVLAFSPFEEEPAVEALEGVLPFDAIGAGDVARVGAKNVSLGEMIGALQAEGGARS